MKDKILHLLIVLFIFPALASAAPKEEKVFANYFDIPVNSPEGTEVIGRIHLERNKAYSPWPKGRTPEAPLPIIA